MPMKKKRMGQRNALYWAKALWSLWNSTDDEDERRFYSRMVYGPAEVMGFSVFGSYLEHAE